MVAPDMFERFSAVAAAREGFRHTKIGSKMKSASRMLFVR